MKDALADRKSWCISIVLEAIEESLARNITKKLSIPTIGIGASVACDGQVLVSEEYAGLTPVTARFVKKYADMSGIIGHAAAEYAKEVRTRKFPDQNIVLRWTKRSN